MSVLCCKWHAEKIVDDLAALEHEQWMKWATTLMNDSSVKIDPVRQLRWKKYMVPYSELAEEVKDYDREWARRVIAILDR